MCLSRALPAPKEPRASCARGAGYSRGLAVDRDCHRSQPGPLPHQRWAGAGSHQRRHPPPQGVPDHLDNTGIVAIHITQQRRVSFKVGGSAARVADTPREGQTRSVSAHASRERRKSSRCHSQQYIQPKINGLYAVELTCSSRPSAWSCRRNSLMFCAKRRGHNRCRGRVNVDQSRRSSHLTRTRDSPSPRLHMQSIGRSSPPSTAAEASAPRCSPCSSSPASSPCSGGMPGRAGCSRCWRS